MKSLDKEYETIALDEPAPGVVVVTLNRPDRYNAMTNTMFDELEQLALALDHEHGCRVVVLTGAGQAFCAGYDLADADELPGLGALGMLDQQERAARALLAVRGMRVPVIAAVNGAAAGEDCRWRSPRTSGSRRPARSSTPRSSGSACRPATSARPGC